MKELYLNDGDSALALARLSGLTLSAYLITSLLFTLCSLQM